MTDDAPKQKPKAVSFYAEDPFELGQGIILPAGGWERVSDFNTMQSSRKPAPRYDLDFTGEQLRELGAFAAREAGAGTHDVIQQVVEKTLIVFPH